MKDTIRKVRNQALDWETVLKHVLEKDCIHQYTPTVPEVLPTHALDNRHTDTSHKFDPEIAL